MRAFSLFLGAAMSVSIVASAVGEPDSKDGIFERAAQELLAKGRDALSGEEYYDALTYFESALVADPGSVEALVAIGRAHEALDQEKTGLAYYDRALELDPNNRPALERQSLALLEKDELEKAESNLDRLELVCGEKEEGCSELETVQEAIETYKQDKASVARAGQDSDGS